MRLACLFCLVSVLHLVAEEPTVPTPVAAFDLARYAGVWYEVARYENRFQRGLVAVTATYTPDAEGKIAVRNAGRKGGLAGEVTESTATAWVVGVARLKVRFFWPFTADYWVIGLDPDYRWAVVANGDPDFLWLLHRDPHPSAADLAAMRAAAAAQGRDPARLQDTPQPTAAPAAP